MNNKLKIKNDKGIEKEYDILLTFESESENKQFVVYTDYQKDLDNNIITYSVFYFKDDQSKKLNLVENKDEQDFIDDLLKNIEFDIKTS